MEINIRASDGSITWTTDNLDGRSAMWLMADALTDMYRYFFDAPLRPIFDPQPARVCIELQADQLGIAFRPEEDLATAKALTAAALVALTERSSVDIIDPFQVMFGALKRDVTDGAII